MLDELIICVGTFLITYAFYKWATINENYFAKKKVKHLRPKFLIGNMGGQFLSRYTIPEFQQWLYNAFPAEP